MSNKTAVEQQESIFGQVSKSVNVGRRRPQKEEVVEQPDLSKFRDADGNIDPFALLEAGIIEIKISTDPYDFAFFEYNRDCNQNHLRQMEASLRENNLLPFNPITTMAVPDGQKVFYHDGTEVANPNTVKGVTDGQHRFGAELNNSVREGRDFRIAYIHIPSELGDAAEIMKMLNTANKNWGNIDHIVNGAKSPVGNEEHREVCARALRLLQNYDWIKPNTAMTLCGITAHSLKRGTAQSRVSPQETARIIAEVEKLVSIDPEFFSSLNDNKTVRAYIQVRQEDNFDFDRLYEALHTSFHRNASKKRAKLVVSHSAKILERSVALKKAHNLYTGGDYNEAPPVAYTDAEIDAVSSD